MAGSKLMLCGRCRLAWFPEKGTDAAACPACGGKARRIPRLFHLGVLVVAAGLALGALQLRRGEGTLATRQAADAGVLAPARPAPSRRARSASAQEPRMARVKARLVLEVASGPGRGGKVTLQRGEQVSILKRDRGALLVQDGKGNRMWVKQEQVTPL
jgi:hypothetical protein